MSWYKCKEDNDCKATQCTVWCLSKPKHCLYDGKYVVEGWEVLGDNFRLIDIELPPK